MVSFDGVAYPHQWVRYFVQQWSNKESCILATCFTHWNSEWKSIKKMFFCGIFKCVLTCVFGACDKFTEHTAQFSNIFVFVISVIAWSILIVLLHFFWRCNFRHNLMVSAQTDLVFAANDVQAWRVPQKIYQKKKNREKFARICVLLPQIPSWYKLSSHNWWIISAVPAYNLLKCALWSWLMQRRV